MKNKIVAIILVGMMLSSVVLSGCEKISFGGNKNDKISGILKDDDNDKIKLVSEDDPWFDCEETKFELIPNGIITDVVMTDDGGLLSVQAQIDNSKMKETLSLEDLEANCYLVFNSSDGKIEEKLLLDKIDTAHEPSGIEKIGDTYLLVKEGKKYKIDIENKKIETDPIDSTNLYFYGSSDDTSKDEEHFYPKEESKVYIGDYCIELLEVTKNNEDEEETEGDAENEYYSSSYRSYQTENVIKMVDKDNNVEEVKLQDVIDIKGGYEVFDEFILPISDNEILLRAESEKYANAKNYYVLNLENKKAKKLDLYADFKEKIDDISGAFGNVPSKKIEILNSRHNDNSIYVEGDKILMLEDGMIKRIDFEAQEIIDEINPLFSYSNVYQVVSSGNFMSASNGQYKYLVCSQEDSLAMYKRILGESSDDSSEEPEFMTICSFSKASKNPNSGKKIVDLACIGDSADCIDNFVCASIFNRESDEYFVRLNMDYLSNCKKEICEEEDIEEDSIHYDEETVQELLVKKIKNDIEDGKAPDVLIFCDFDNSINKEDYLVDLTEYYSKLDKENYFSNIIEANKTDDKLYQIPLFFTLDGMVLSSDDVKKLDENQKGFDLDSYEKFRKELEGSSNKKRNYYEEPEEDDLMPDDEDDYNESVNNHQRLSKKEDESLVSDGEDDEMNRDYSEDYDYSSNYKDNSYDDSYNRSYNSYNSYSYEEDEDEMDDDVKGTLRDLLLTTENPIVKDNKLNIDNDEFKAIVDYIKDNQKNRYCGFDHMGKRERDISFSTFASIYSLYSKQNDKTDRIYGIPGFKEHAPNAVVTTSVAIAATSSCKNGALEYIDTLMKNFDMGLLESDESISKSFEKVIFINKEEQKKINDKLLSKLDSLLEMEKIYAKNQPEFSKEYDSTNDDSYMDVDDIKDNMDYLYDVIETVTRNENLNEQVFNVIVKNLQSYFSNQKSYEEVLEKITKDCEEIL